jgi:hypothetical protein
VLKPALKPNVYAGLVLFWRVDVCWVKRVEQSLGSPEIVQKGGMLVSEMRVHKVKPS